MQMNILHDASSSLKLSKSKRYLIAVNPTTKISHEATYAWEQFFYLSDLHYWKFKHTHSLIEKSLPTLEHNLKSIWNSHYPDYNDSRHNIPEVMKKREIYNVAIKICDYFRCILKGDANIPISMNDNERQNKQPKRYLFYRPREITGSIVQGINLFLITMAMHFGEYLVNHAILKVKPLIVIEHVNAFANNNRKLLADASIPDFISCEEFGSKYMYCLRQIKSEVIATIREKDTHKKHSISIQFDIMAQQRLLNVIINMLAKALRHIFTHLLEVSTKELNRLKESNTLGCRIASELRKFFDEEFPLQDPMNVDRWAIDQEDSDIEQLDDDGNVQNLLISDHSSSSSSSSDDDDEIEQDEINYLLKNSLTPEERKVKRGIKRTPTSIRKTKKPSSDDDDGDNEDNDNDDDQRSEDIIQRQLEYVRDELMIDLEDDSIDNFNCNDQLVRIEPLNRTTARPKKDPTFKGNDNVKKLTKSVEKSIKTAAAATTTTTTTPLDSDIHAYNETKLSERRQTISKSKIFTQIPEKLAKRARCILCSKRCTNVSYDIANRARFVGCALCIYVCIKLNIDPELIITRIEQKISAPILFDENFKIVNIIEKRKNHDNRITVAYQ